MNKVTYAIIGLIMGAAAGFVVATGIAYLVLSFTSPPSEWTPLASKGFGLILGIPIGAIVFCVIGYWLGRKQEKLKDSSNLQK
jgi:uncharacterized protein YneF (UPF0154 family)